jgi:hypothetical protein
MKVLKNLYFLFLFWHVANAMAQLPVPNIKIETSPSSLIIGEKLTINVIIQDEEEYQVEKFPELKGFIKESNSVSHNFININKKKVKKHIVSQTYIAEVAGKYNFGKLEFIVNDKLVETEKIEVEVKKEDNIGSEKNIEINNVALVLETSASEVYVGEGLKVNLGFYISDKTTSDWQFNENIGTQVEEIYRKLKPTESLESRMVISNISGKPMSVNGEKFTYYNLLEVVFYPLNKKSFILPSISISMQKKQGNEWMGNTLSSKAKNINVKELPPHPLKEKVPVGTLRLYEDVKGKKSKQTGESFEYNVRIEGKANFRTVNLEEVKNTIEADFFLNNSKTYQPLGSETGSKSLSYKVVPKLTGSFDFSSVFSLIFFNTEKSTYDTLKSNRKLEFSGANIIGASESKSDIYSNIENLKTDGKNINIKNIFKLVANLVVGFLAVVLLYIIKKN